MFECIEQGRGLGVEGDGYLENFLSDLAIIGVRCPIAGSMESHPAFYVSYQALLGAQPEEFTSGNSFTRKGAHIDLNPALHEFPAQFVGELEVLNRAGPDRFPLVLAEPGHGGLVLTHV